jgi:glycosidase
MFYNRLILLFLCFFIVGCGIQKPLTNDQNSADKSDKIIIYQMMVRLFGNKETLNKTNGTILENGTGKFNDIDKTALFELKKMGISHIWYTGVIEHATVTDYTNFGIKQDDPDIVKGLAGSPYAIKDYYDVSPDLAINVPNRLYEFESLIKRTHEQGLKVLIDFVPNHVARTYHSDAKPLGIQDFGANDLKSESFNTKNDFYYIPGKKFIVPNGTNPGGNDFKHPMKDMFFDEPHARATGNNIFSEKPSLNDWSETVKLNYGIDYLNNDKTYFNPIPPVWLKMRDILVYWAKKDVDGFRCDVAEMVPVEFWAWIIPEVKKVNPNIVFIAESYNPSSYQSFLSVGQFDYLYDKVGLYDALKRLIKNDSKATVNDISQLTIEQETFKDKMLRFLENHDEERIASAGFASNPWHAVPAMVVSATLSGGPVMIYFGQEVGEPGKGTEGFGGEDNRTSIFDYWGVPEHQKWMNNGLFNGAKLSEDQKKLREFYSNLLNFSSNNKAITQGKFIELKNQLGFNNDHYAYLRYTSNEHILVISNFNKDEALKTTIKLPLEIIQSRKKLKLINVLSGEDFIVNNVQIGIPVDVPAMGAWILKF